MPGIKVVVVLVKCLGTLLLCEDIDTRSLSFEDFEECSSKLPALIEQERRGADAGMVVMGRCRVRLEEPHRPGRGAPGATSG
jgi:hypothetical protein